MSTVREVRLAKALKACSADDMHRLINAHFGDCDSGSKWDVQRRLLEFANKHAPDDHDPPA